MEQFPRSIPLLDLLHVQYVVVVTFPTGLVLNPILSPSLRYGYYYPPAKRTRQHPFHPLLGTPGFLSIMAGPRGLRAPTYGYAVYSSYVAFTKRAIFP